MRLTWLICALVVLGTVATNRVARRVFDKYKCKGEYDASMVINLISICEDCYNLLEITEIYDQCANDCFTGERFKSCVDLLHESDRLDDFKTYIKKIHGTEPSF
nr:venom polypeptide precursor [Doratifera vulnerans]